MILLLLTFITKEIHSLAHGKKTMTKKFARKVVVYLFSGKVKRT